MVIFLRTNSTFFDIIVNALSLIAIIFQTYYANLSLRKGLPNNQFQIYLKYFFSKLFYISTNLLENTIKIPISCYLNIISKDQCSQSSIGANSILTILWFLIEVYFTYIVYVFYKRNLNSDIALRQGINLEDWPMLLNEMLTEAIPIEVKGFQVKTDKKYLVNIQEDMITSTPISNKGANKLNRAFETEYITLVI